MKNLLHINTLTHTYKFIYASVMTFIESHGIIINVMIDSIFYFTRYISI